MTKKRHDCRPQTNQLHHEEETHTTDTNTTLPFFSQHGYHFRYDRRAYTWR